MSGLFYVHQHKPAFCDLFIICAGKQVYLRGNNDEQIMEDDKGVMVARMRDKITFKDWLDKMFNDKNNDSLDRTASPSSNNLDSSVTQNHWESCLQEIDNYYQQLLSSSNLDDGTCRQDNDPIEPDVTERNYSIKVTKQCIDIYMKHVALISASIYPFCCISFCLF